MYQNSHGIRKKWCFFASKSAVSLGMSRPWTPGDVKDTFVRQSYEIITTTTVTTMSPSASCKASCTAAGGSVFIEWDSE